LYTFLPALAIIFVVFSLTADIHNGMNADAAAAQLIVFTACAALNLFRSYYTHRSAD